MAKSLWEEFKDLFKTNEQREKEKQEGVADALQKEKDVVKQLEELDKQYKDSLPKEEEPDLEALFPSDSGLREHEYTPRSDEEIEAEARADSDLKKDAERDKLQEKFDEKADDANLQKLAAERALQNKNADLDDEYASLAEDEKENALKNGVARGSILSSALKELSAQKQSDKDSNAAAYLQKIEDIDAQTQYLKAELDAALEQLDMKYAVELSENIKKLKEQRDKETEKWEKYNRDIQRQQAEFEYNREQDINEYLLERELQKQNEQKAEEQREQQFGYQGEKQKNYAKRYEIAYDFYMSLDPEIAYDALEASPNMQYYLGLYYDKLKKELRARSSSNNKRYF